MSESVHRTRSGTCKKRIAVGAAFTLLGIYGAPKVSAFMYDASREDSIIVAGVPGQVEGHRSREIVKGNSRLTTYELLIEQSKVDVQAAQESHGKPLVTTHYNPKLGELAASSVIDWVDVPEAAYYSFNNGSSVVFTGDGHPLQRGLEGRVRRETVTKN